MPSVKDVTEKPVPDSKSVKEVSADSFSTWKPAKQKNTLISNEKTTQVNNNHNESKLNSFAKEYVHVHNQDHPQLSLNLQVNLTVSGLYETKNDLASIPNNLFDIDKAPLTSIACQNPFNKKISAVSANELNSEKPGNEDIKIDRPNNLNELLNPNADIFVPMARQKPLKGIEIIPINSVNFANLKNNIPSQTNNNVPNACEKLKSSETAYVTSDNNSTELNLDTQENLKKDNANNSVNLLNFNTHIACQKPAGVEEKSNCSNNLYSDKQQNLKNNCFNPRTKCVPTKTNIPKDFNSDVPENLKNDFPNNLKNLFTSSDPIDCQKHFNFVISDENSANKFNPNATPFVPIACQTTLKSKIREAVCLSSVDNLCNPTLEPCVSQTSTEAKKISKFVPLNHIGEDEKILTVSVDR